MTQAQLSELDAFEAEWDPRVGGFGARGHREVMFYILGRLLGAGVTFEDLQRYQRAVYERFAIPPARPGTMPS